MESAATTPLAPPDDDMPTAKSGKVYSDKVVSFHSLDLPESARQNMLASCFNQDVSWPMYGPCYIRGDTDADANQLILRMTRVAVAFTLLIDVGCTGAASTAMERLLQRRQLIFTALQGIDGAEGRSVKAGASPTLFSSLTVDKDGQASAAGTNLASFHIKLLTSSFRSAPLWLQSVAVLRQSKQLLFTDNVIREGAWPTFGETGRRILIPAQGPDISHIAVSTSAPFSDISDKVLAALVHRNADPSEVVLARTPADNSTETCILICLDSVLLSYLLLSCEELGTTGVPSFHTELHVIRQRLGTQPGLPPLLNATRTSAGAAPGGSLRGAAPYENRIIKLNKPEDSQFLLPAHLLDILPDNAVFLRDPNRVGCGSVMSINHFVSGLDDFEVIGEVITMILKALRGFYPSGHPDLSIERWLRLVGVQHVWVGQLAVARILIYVRPGIQHMLIVDGLHGQCLPWDKEGLQLIYLNYPLCICFDCQRYRRHTSGVACLDCCSTGHLAGDVNCPHFQRRLARVAERREAARAAEAAVARASSQQAAGLTNEETARQAQSSKRAAATQLVPELSSSSDATGSDAATEELLRDLADMEAERAQQAKHKEAASDGEWQSVGQGKGRGRGGKGKAAVETGGARGAGKGQKGKRGDDVITWLCAFCNTPTGSVTEHQRKYCERLFRPPPVHEISRARCAFCGHGHLFTECPILLERGGLHWLPARYLEMCEFQGYPTIRVGKRPGRCYGFRASCL